MSDRQRKSALRSAVPWLLPALIIVFWHISTTTGIVAGNILPQPLQVARTFVDLLKNGELARNVGISAQRAVIGFLIGGFIGFALGLFNGVWARAEMLLDTTIQMVRNIPHLALIPIVILWFGIGEGTKVLLVSLGVFFPIYLNTFHGIRSVDPKLVEMGKVYGYKGLPLYLHVILPGALPSILVGVRQSLGIMWLTLIVAETVAANSGIGYMAMNAREYMRMDIIVLSILLYALLGKLSDSLAKWLERSWLRWHPNFTGKR
ncbi:ABC transporter permease subunit [Paenibacillus sp. HN-1]|uniref:ABC transporter permease subunit n=1 Tax=Paenibacillus TaxID=44249 RepID=UPI001CA9F89F|nr:MULTISPECIES: ABC transporter permease subunit [Paenibacillus]MBY9080529.1 ABC transporter permease subunit [Paenibacillus sp. CGMCC 1.18879]MBY9085526.1 ABC transporter permease subunit [Paenibacillus sinensis]